nr:biotin--[acetyl-CoA-carboxylase] ligase [uncultured Dethiosulfovibrio sp.]
MKTDIVAILRKAGDHFVSGQAICDQLQVSRTAVWKHINQLKDDGYVIESIPKKGYRITVYPDRVTEYEISPWLKTVELGRNLVHRHTVDSTNILAKGLAREGCPDGTVVTAEHQTTGRGRSGRRWTSIQEGAIQMSIVLRPHVSPAKAPSITQIGAASIALALESLGISPRIKWPNDVLISGRKVCGILTEMSCELDHIHFIVMGIGINVNVRSFPEEISSVATSLALEGQGNLNRASLTADVLNRLEPLYRSFLQGDSQPFLSVCRRLSWLRDKAISFSRNGESLTGVAGDIDDQGRLEVIFPDGTSDYLLSGEVHIGSI